MDKVLKSQITRMYLITWCSDGNSPHKGRHIVSTGDSPPSYHQLLGIEAELEAEHEGRFMVTGVFRLADHEQSAEGEQ